jgi:predicted ATP-dependent serine protease
MVDDLSDHGGAIVVRGEAGIGKSALLAATSQHAHDHGVMVLSAARPRLRAPNTTALRRSARIWLTVSTARQTIHGALYSPIACRIAVRSSAAHSSLIFPSLTR